MEQNNLEMQIKELQARNQRVEADKAWETSWTRKICIAVLTYFVISIFFLIIKTPRAFISALVPTLGFILSTISLSFAKKIWLKNKYLKKL